MKHLHRLLLAAAIVAPTLLFASAAWQSRVAAIREGENEIIRSITALRDDVQLQLDVEKRTVATVEDHIKGLSWQQISQPDTSAFLENLAESLEGIEAIWIADPDGYVQATSEPWAPGVRVPEQEFFASKRDDGQTNVYLSTAIEGTPPSISSVEVVFSRMTPNGTFNGTIHAGLSIIYLEHHFTEATPDKFHSVLLRDDGVVLADNESDLPNYYFSPRTPLMRHVVDQPVGRVLTDGETLYSYLKVPGFPVYISVGANRSAILQRWYGGLVLYGTAAVAASLALMSLSWLAIRSARAREVALVRLNCEIEQRMKTEERLRVSERLEVVGQLAAGIAHDFNNLLTIMLGSLELLLTAQERERIESLAERAIQAGRRGAHLVSMLLTFAGRQVVQVVKVDLNALLRDMLPLIEQSVGDIVQVKLRLGAGLHDCHADVGQLELALLNLAVNARDAMPEGGTLTISTQNVYLTKADFVMNPEAIDGSYVATAFQDTGTGMTDEVKAKVFDPFFTTKEVGQGTGLGLSQVLGLIRQLGGDVTVDSKVNLGTTVMLYLPAFLP